MLRKNPITTDQISEHKSNGSLVVRKTTRELSIRLDMVSTVALASPIRSAVPERNSGIKPQDLFSLRNGLRSPRDAYAVNEGNVEDKAMCMT